jgi:AraC family transcriptional regulator
MKLASGQFYGHTVSNREVSGFNLTETVYTPRFRIAKHSHERSYFGLVLQGTYSEKYGTRTRVCQPSMLVFHPADEEHSQHFDRSEGRLFRIEISPRWLQDLSHRAAVRNESADFQGARVCWLAARVYEEFRNMDEASPLVIEGLGLEMLGEMTREVSLSRALDMPHWLLQAREVIHGRALQSVTLSNVASEVGIHPVHLAREFRRRYHQTVGDYIQHLRIETARRQMIDTDAPLAEIAVACGFHDQSHFSKAFKRLMHTTPAAYRAKRRLS